MLLSLQMTSGSGRCKEIKRNMERSARAPACAHDSCLSFYVLPVRLEKHVHWNTPEARQDFYKFLELSQLH